MTRLANRCALTAALVVTMAGLAFAQAAPVLDDFVLFGATGLRARGLVVEDGDVGTNATLIGTRRIDAGDSRIVGNRVELDKASSCDELLANTAQTSGQCGPAQPVGIPVVANLASACGFPNPFPTQCSGQNIVVGHDGFAERGPGNYNVVDVAGGGQGPGTLVLSAGTYTFCSLRLGRNASLLASGPVTINVIGSFKLDNGSQVRPQSGSIGPCDIEIFAGTTGKVRISRKAHVQGFICAPNAKLEITVGANLRGGFFAREVKSDRVFLERAVCLPPTSTSTTSAPTTSAPATSTSTTTTTVPVCGNGIVESGEQCDPPGSAGAAFCGPGGTCNSECQCEGGATTTSSSTVPGSTSSTSTSSSTITTTTTIAVCGNQIVETGEQCDPPGSAGAAFCGPGGTCNSECQCEGGETTTSSSTTVPTTSTSSSTTTTTTTPVCGNQIVESGEQCDPPGSAGAAFCGPGGTCNSECQCEGGETTTSTSSTSIPPSTTSSSLAPSTTTTTTSTSTSVSTTSSTSTSLLATTSSTSSSTVPTTSSTVPTTSSTVPTTSSTVPTTSSTTVAPTTSSSSSTSSTSTSTTSSLAPTTTTIGGVASGFDFLSTPGAGTCGNTFRETAGTTALKNLLCGSLSLGGGFSQVPDNATPPGATNRFTLSNCVGGQCNIGTTAAGSTPAGIDCTAPNCKFGTPLPISNAGLSVCVTNTFFPSSLCLGAGAPFACCTGAGTGTCAGPSGTLNLTTGAATWDFKLNSATVLTGNPTQPCPVCAVAVGGAACVGSPASPCTGVCDGSPNQGAVCTTKNPKGLTSECPSPNAVVGTQRCYRGTANNNVCSTGADCPGGLCAQFIGNIPISLDPLTTGTATLSSATSIFCPGQTTNQRGAFRSDICNGGTNSGKPCTTLADCPGATACRSGLLTNLCVGGTGDGQGCSNSTTCGGGVCTRAGTLVQLIREVGVPAGALSIGVARPITLGSAFCVQATTNPTVNSNANLPGPGATSVVGSITLLP